MIRQVGRGVPARIPAEQRCCTCAGSREDSLIKDCLNRCVQGHHKDGMDL